jgi:hypothetical protein
MTIIEIKNGDGKSWGLPLDKIQEGRTRRCVAESGLSPERKAQTERQQQVPHHSKFQLELRPSQDITLDPCNLALASKLHIETYCELAHHVRIGAITVHLPEGT